MQIGNNLRKVFNRIARTRLRCAYCRPHKGENAGQRKERGNPKPRKRIRKEMAL